MDLKNTPLVSLVILTYNQCKYIGEALEGALSQDYPNLEIIVSDDNSPDGTFDIVSRYAEIYKGPHKLIINKNSPNLGIVGQVNKLLQEFAHGELIMLSGGDDVCLPNTISSAVSTLQKLNAVAVSFNARTIDGNSNQTGYSCADVNKEFEIYFISDYLRGTFRTSGACRIFRRSVFDEFGPIGIGCPTEDSPNLFRAFLLGGVGYSYGPNIKYRIHGNNISGLHSLMTKFNPADIYNQYRRDLGVAVSKGLVSKENYILLERHLDRYLRIGVAIRRIYGKSGFLCRMCTALTYIFKRGYDLADIRNLLGQVRDWRRT